MPIAKFEKPHINALISGRQDALNVIIVVVIGLIIIFVIKRNKNHFSGEY